MDKTKTDFIIMVGNVGSGKSSLAAKMVMLDPKNIVVSRDAIVTMIAGGMYKYYDKTKKNLYFQVEKSLILASLGGGWPVIIDRTNETRRSREKYIDFVKGKARIICYDFGPGTLDGMQRRMVGNRGRNPEEWIAVHKEIKNGYEAPRKEEGIDKIFLMHDRFDSSHTKIDT